MKSAAANYGSGTFHVHAIMHAYENKFRRKFYSTVTDFAKLRGLSTSQPRSTAI